MSHSDELHSEHTQEAIAQRISSVRQHSYLGDFILGAVDGAVTTFAIVAGGAGADLSNGVVLVLGFANVLADGFSMAAGNYLSARSDQQLLERFRRMEERHIDQIPQGEQQEIRQIYRAKGFDGDILERIVAVITEDRQRWINTMLTEEWGLQLQPPSAWRSAAATFVAFILAGLIPLMPAVLSPAAHAAESFPLSSILTGVAFFGIGLIRGRVVEDRPLIAGLETLFIGGTAATVAYLVGLLLQGMGG